MTLIDCPNCGANQIRSTVRLCDVCFTYEKCERDFQLREIEMCDNERKKIASELIELSKNYESKSEVAKALRKAAKIVVKNSK